MCHTDLRPPAERRMRRQQRGIQRGTSSCGGGGRRLNGWGADWRMNWYGHVAVPGVVHNPIGQKTQGSFYVPLGFSRLNGWGQGEGTDPHGDHGIVYIQYTHTN